MSSIIRQLIVAGLLIMPLSFLSAKQIELKVSGMVCGACEKKIQDSLLKIPGVKEVRANHDKGAVAIVTDDAKKISQETLIQTIRKAGFKVEESL